VGYAPFGVLINPAGTLVYVANTADNTVSIIDAKTNTVTATIPVKNGPMQMCLSPDGKQLYVTNSGDFVQGAMPPGTVTVINTANNTIIATIPVGQYPIGIFATADGSKVYVNNDFGSGNTNQGTVSVINTASMTVEKTINVGQDPGAFGNFLSPGTLCTGNPITFTIIVNPTPVITADKPSGSITTCDGTASAAPNIQQFTVSATSLVQNLAVTAPDGFEVSLNPNTGYAGTLEIAPSESNVNSTVVYVRLAASAPTGNAAGNVVLTSEGAVTQNVPVSGTVQASFTPAFSISASSVNICAGSLVTFTATATNAGTGPVYQWLVNGNNAGANAPTFTTAVLVNGDIVSCSISSSSACAIPPVATSNSITMSVVNITARPSVSITSSSNPVCQGSPVIFTAAPANAGNTPAYQWLVNGHDAMVNAPVFTSSTLNNGDTVACIMTANLGCTLAVASNSIITTVLPLPVVNAGENQTITSGNQVQLSATVSGNVSSFSWSPAAGLSEVTSLTPIASPAITTTYTLTALSADGCTGTGSVNISVRPASLFIPNTFTPNGDGVNDTWTIKYLDLYTTCIVRIYDRWGHKLYHSTGYGIPWDGTYNNRPLPTGTYYYLIDLNDGSKLLSGFVAIIR
jgi:gliding motility-associated-like protein